MKKLLLLLFIGCAVTLLPAQDGGQLTDAEISFTFVSKKVEGSLSGFASSSKIDLNDISNSKLKGSVATKTLESGNFLRNWSLKGSKYFDVDTYPTMRFESRTLQGTADEFTAEGELTIKKTSKPITIRFKKQGDRIIGTTQIYASDFGINVIKKSREANKVLIKMSFKVQ